MFTFISLGIDPRNNKQGLDIEAFGPDDVVITDGNGTIISNPAKRENSANATIEETTTDAPKERKRREAEGKNENGEEKTGVEPVSMLLEWAF